MRSNEEFETIYDAAVNLAKVVGADAVLLLLDGPVDWQLIKERADGQRIVVAVEEADQVVAAVEAEMPTVLLKTTEVPVYDRLSQALLKAIADELLAPGSRRHRSL